MNKEQIQKIIQETLSEQDEFEWGLKNKIEALEDKVKSLTSTASLWWRNPDLIEMRDDLPTPRIQVQMLNKESSHRYEFITSMVWNHLLGHSQVVNIECRWLETTPMKDIECISFETLWKIASHARNDAYRLGLPLYFITPYRCDLIDLTEWGERMKDVLNE